MELNWLRPSDAYMRQQTNPVLAQIMARHISKAKPLPDPMMTNCQLER